MSPSSYPSLFSAAFAAARSTGLLGEIVGATLPSSAALMPQDRAFASHASEYSGP
jgi:hypothetical protein